MHIFSWLKRLILLFTPPIIINIYNGYKIKPSRYLKRNKSVLQNFSHRFEVLEFSLIDVDSPYDLKWGWWSRIFEYELALSKITELGAERNSTIHNTCWGYHGSHILFKNALESISSRVTNSDILSSSISNTTLYDLRKRPTENWRNAFDFVINISTIEEIAAPHLEIIENLLAMVKPNGILLATFDIPGIQLREVEELFGAKVCKVPNPVDGLNSPYQMNEFASLTAGYFIIRKL
jgi:hypothetical protein